MTVSIAVPGIIEGDSLATAMWSSYRSTSTVQGFIREELKKVEEESTCLDEVMNNICGAVAAFKTATEDQIEGIAHDKELVKLRRKQANNVINDVSRICREVVGQTVKLKSRKHGYNYTYAEVPDDFKGTPPTKAFTPPVGKTLIETRELDSVLKELESSSAMMLKQAAEAKAMTGLLKDPEMLAKFYVRQYGEDGLRTIINVAKSADPDDEPINPEILPEYLRQLTES